VVVRDAACKVLDKGKLGVGNYWTSGDCFFEFTVDNMPRSDFYKTEIRRRGTLTYSYTDIVAADWTVRFSIGGR
jgi:hypothetical protein